MTSFQGRTRRRARRQTDSDGADPLAGLTDAIDDGVQHHARFGEEASQLRNDSVTIGPCLPRPPLPNPFAVVPTRVHRLGHGRQRVSATANGACSRRLAGQLGKTYFDEEEGADESAPADRLVGAGQGAVVAADDQIDADAEGASAFHGQAEVEPVAGVVERDQQHPGVIGRSRRPDGRRDPTGRRRTEDATADGGAQHPAPHQTGGERLVAAAAARYHRHSALAAKAHLSHSNTNLSFYTGKCLSPFYL